MILLIHTCGLDSVVALSANGKIVAQETMRGREASEKIIPVVRRLLASADPLEAIGVVRGPGSFTGVRVGLSVAKGLCEARGAGLVTMSRLQLVALGAHRDLALAVLDAGRGEFYCGFYRGGAVEREEILKLEPLLALARYRDVVTCEPQVHEKLSQHLQLALVAEPGADELLSLTLARVQHDEWSDVATVDANYLRRTDAELLVELS